MKRRLAALLVAVALILGGSAAITAAPAHADTATASPSPSPSPAKPNVDNACTSSQGVWVVVEIEGKAYKSGCAHNPTNGEDALVQIGITITKDGKGFICELDARPAGNCGAAFSGKYWAYFHATRAGAALGPWAYADTAANGYTPAAGTMEGWNFGEGAAPAVVLASSSAQASTKPSTQPTSTDAGGASPLPTILTIAAVVVVAGVVAFVVMRRRRA